MNERVQAALALWGLEAGAARPAALRENEVWKVEHAGRAYALRLHRVGYRTLAELRSELQWMAMLSGQGITVPAPLPAMDGSLIVGVDGVNVSVLDWLEGVPAAALGEVDPAHDPFALSHSIGAAMARMHDASDSWTPPEGFTRPDWRREGLLGEDPLWGQFWAHPDLSADDRALLLRARATADEALQGIEAGTDQGLIHADILGENVLVQDGRPAFIDFDDCAWGFRDFELATWLLKFRHRSDASEMRAALLDGYAARRTVVPEQLDLFLLLRAFTYPGWIMARRHEPGGAERSARVVAQALDLSRRFLGEHR